MDDKLASASHLVLTALPEDAKLKLEEAYVVPVAGSPTAIFLAVIFGATLWVVIACVKGAATLAVQYGKAGETSGTSDG